MCAPRSLRKLFTEDVDLIGTSDDWGAGKQTSWNVNAPRRPQVGRGPGPWNDPDMLVVGRPGLTLPGSRSRFALWATTAAPLMPGDDIRTMSAEISAVLRNPRLISVNQDPLDAGGRRVRDDGETKVLARPLSDGSVAVGLFNRGSAAVHVNSEDGEIPADLVAENDDLVAFWDIAPLAPVHILVVPAGVRVV